MPSNYTGNPTATQAPGPTPGPGVLPIFALPVDGDSDNGATFAQSFKEAADFIAYLQTYSFLLYSLFGTGSDGAVDLDGTNTYSFISGGGGTYTLNRRIYPTTLRVRSGIALKPFGFPIFAKTSATVDSGGTIGADGVAGSGISGNVTNNPISSALASTYELGMTSGGKGGSSTGPTNADAGVGYPSVSFVLGGAGGAGGRGNPTGGTLGGAGGASAVANGIFTISDIITAFRLSAFMAGVSSPFFGGGGGGGAGWQGGGAYAPNGGTGAGIIAIFSPILTNNGTISAVGGKGGDATSGSNGGGGGGGGGAVLYVAHSAGGSGTINVGGGAAGLKQNLGVDGTAGSTGNIFAFSV